MASSVVSASEKVQPLIEGYQQIDPRLYDILSQLSISLADVQAVVFPPGAAVIQPPISEIAPDTPLNFRYSTTKRNLVFDWDDTPNAQYYELRQGTSWNTAQFVTRTISLEVKLDPIVVGSTPYLLKSVSAGGIYSANAAGLTVIIGPIGTITINSRIIDNNVILAWSVPDSVWDIDYYTVTKPGIVLSIQRGTFIAAFESAAGTFTYSITPTDLAGNVGPTCSITLTVSQPPDFELLDFRKSILSELKINAIPYGSPVFGWVNDEFVGWDANKIAGQNWTWDAGNTGKLLVCVDPFQTWDQHFAGKGWNTIQDQLSAGYPLYVQYTVLTAKYQEVIDYGLVINNTLFTMNYTLDQLVTTGTVSDIPGVEGSLDRITWTPIVHSKSVFLSSFRYVRATVDFTSNNDKALALFYNLTYSINVKHDLDSGNVIALASDPGGTIVYFNKVFKDIDSITLTATKSIEPLTLIYDFLDVPNPTYFKVLVFNSSGVRTDAEVSWKARGIT
jgi:hypothetical protein